MGCSDCSGYIGRYHLFLAPYVVSSNFVFYPLSQVFFGFCKLLLQVAVRCCELFLKLITLLGLSKLFPVGFGLFYVAWVLQVVKLFYLCRLPFVAVSFKLRRSF